MELMILTPQITLVIGAILLLLLSLFVKTKVRVIAVGTILVSLGLLISLYNVEATQILYGTVKFDSFSKAFNTLFLVGAALILLVGKEERPEFYFLYLSALTGATFVSSSVDLITLFVGLELVSIASYILVGLNRSRRLANEAAMKYVISGGISTAFMLFGFSYLYGITGTTNLMEMVMVYQNGIAKETELLLLIGFFLSFIGLSFKIASVPFHMWAPDVYQGAKTNVTTFLGAISKMVGFVLIVRVLFYLFNGLPNAEGTSLLFFTVQQYLAVLAGLSMIVGNVMALKQRSVKRMLAYSSVAHAGYMMVALVAFSGFFFDTLWFYSLAYMFMTIGAFTVIHLLENKEEDIQNFAGLYRRSPYVAIAMTIFLLSLAGIPGTAGFIGKVNIFLGAFAVNPAQYILAFLMIAMSVVSFVYYFGVMLQMFSRPSNGEKVMVPTGARIVLVICVLATIGFGLFPNIAMDFFYTQWPVVKDFMQ